MLGSHYLSNQPNLSPSMRGASVYREMAGAASLFREDESLERFLTVCVAAGEGDWFSSNVCKKYKHMISEKSTAMERH